MEQDQDLTQLIGEIYEAALDSSRWTGVLAQIAHHVGGQAAGLLSRTQSEIRHVSTIRSASILDFVQLYSETYWKFDPVASLRPTAKSNKS